MSSIFEWYLTNEQILANTLEKKLAKNTLIFKAEKIV